MLAEQEAAQRAEQQRREAAAKGFPADDIIMAIERAAPFLDEGSDPTKWPPSGMLKIGYCVLLGGNFPNRKAAARQFVGDHLGEARRRYRAGMFSDPFAKEPRMRG